MNYLPEWKIFLWKKLILDADKYHDFSECNIKDLANGYPESDIAREILELTTAESVAVKIDKNISKPEELLISSFRMSLNKELLEQRLKNYINAFSQGDLMAELGKRYLRPELQRQNFASAIKLLASGYGYKNIAVTMREICDIMGWQQKPSMIEQHRFYETMLSFEQSGDFEIINLRADEIIFSIAPQSLKHFKDEFKIIPSYSKFEKELEQKPLKWSCPICRSHIDDLDSRETIEEYLKKFSNNDFAKCKDRRHLNRFWIKDDLICFETIPVKITELVSNKK